MIKLISEVYSPYDMYFHNLEICRSLFLLQILDLKGMCNHSKNSNHTVPAVCQPPLWVLPAHLSAHSTFQQCVQ